MIGVIKLSVSNVIAIQTALTICALNTNVHPYQGRKWIATSTVIAFTVHVEHCNVSDKTVSLSLKEFQLPLFSPS